MVSIITEGDIRVGLEILRKFGAEKKAEDKNLRKITMEEIKQAANRTPATYISSLAEDDSKKLQLLWIS
ncbi:MAG: hypothetical protein QXF82_05555 [Nitrososphaeria archaeon]